MRYGSKYHILLIIRVYFNMKLSRQEYQLFHNSPGEQDYTYR